MIFKLEELCQLYIRAIVHSIGKGSRVYGTLLEEFPKGLGDTVDEEHNVSYADRWSVGEDHTVFRGHATRMCPRS